MHKAMNRFRSFFHKVSLNNTRTCWVLKCDIRKFFASIDQQILFNILTPHILDERMQALIGNIVESFYSKCPTPGVGQKGLPLGNLTSQLLVNVYMNEFDQFVKHKLKVKYYVRYADDFVLLSHDRDYLLETLPHMEVFLRKRLKLTLHPDKLFIKTLASGVDFLGWVHFSDHRVLRTATKRRMFRRLAARLNLANVAEDPAVESYRGMLLHGNAHGISDLLP